MRLQRLMQDLCQIDLPANKSYLQYSNYHIQFIINKMSSTSATQNASKRNLRMSALRTTLKACPVIKKRSDELEELVSRNKFQKDRLTLTKPSLSNSDSVSIHESQEDESIDEFFENYELVEKIGEGCNATVYRCIYKSSGKIYAVKKMKVEQEHILTMKRDFIILKELNHPSICKYKALYILKEQRTAYLVMEYLPLSSLENYRPDNQEELRTIVRELLGALQYLHSKNICHRDIKPENILFDKVEKKVKLIDFGISKKTFLRGQRRDMLTIIGTHYYMAPEVFVGGGYDERVDLWALGASIFKMVTGTTPFESQYHSESLKKIREGVVDFQSSLWSNFSPKLIMLVQSLLKKVDQRITLNQALKHPWFLQGSQKQSKLRRLCSSVQFLHVHFHDEFNNNIKNAISKEEGEQNESKRLFKSIKSITSNTFDLEDSDDEQSVVSPSIANKRDNLLLRQCSDSPSFYSRIHELNQ